MRDVIWRAKLTEPRRDPTTSRLVTELFRLPLGFAPWCPSGYRTGRCGHDFRIGASDSALLVGQSLVDSLGQQIIIDNRGGSTMAAEIAQKAPPDGYTLLLEGGSFWVAPLLRPMPYDPVRDFSPVTTVTTSPNLLVVHASVPANSVKELIALAKAKPGALKYASAVGEGSSHLRGIIESMVGVNIVRIDYKGQVQRSARCSRGNHR